MIKKYIGTIIISSRIDRESFIKTLKEIEDKYKEFGGIPIMHSSTDCANGLIDLSYIVGVCKSINYDNLEVEFEIIENTPSSRLLSNMIEEYYSDKDIIYLDLYPRMISSEKKNDINIISNITGFNTVFLTMRGK